MEYQWSVLQYVIIRPAGSIAGIICEALGVLCKSDGYSWRYASVWIEGINFVSIRYALVLSFEAYFVLILFHLLSIALYGLLVFYGLVHEELKGRRPMAKFLSIKLIVMFTFYQSFVVSTLHSPLGVPFSSLCDIRLALSR
jgi:hypothetical protein